MISTLAYVQALSKEGECWVRVGREVAELGEYDGPREGTQEH